MLVKVDCKVRSYKEWKEIEKSLHDAFKYWFLEEKGPEVELRVEAAEDARKRWHWERRKNLKPKRFTVCPSCRMKQPITDTCRRCGYTGA